MDLQKDTSKQEGLAKFVETSSVRTNPFGENRVGERAYRRVERISSAIVVLTAHIESSDPIRIRAREIGVELLQAVLGLKDEMRAINSRAAVSVRSLVREAISVTRLLAVAGHVSFQNAEILSEALDEMSSFLLASQRSTLSESVSLTRDDLTDVREFQKHQKVRSVQEMSDTSQKDSSTETDVVQSVPTSISSLVPSSPNSNRTQAIMEVLRSNGEVGIRDIASHLPEYSEKMIQRELADLVLAGAVRKTGEKRWSRYTIAR